MRLLSNERATPSTRVVRIALDGVPYTYHAGQAAAIGVAADDRLTPYSIASAPHDTAEYDFLEFLVKVDGSNRFGALVTDLPPGTRIFVSAASGAFELPEALDRPLLFIAGGTGIAPMRSMIREAIHRNADARPALIYSARTPDEFAYLSEFRDLADQGRIALTLTLTGDWKDDWAHARGRAGVGHLEGLATANTLCFVCGPPAMVTELPRALASMGVPRDRIRTEGW